MMSAALMIWRHSRIEPRRALAEPWTHGLAMDPVVVSPLGLLGRGTRVRPGKRFG